MKTRTHKDTRTPAFTATLFTIAKLRKQPECPSADERRKRAWNTNAAEQTLGYAMGFSRQEYWSGLPCPLPGDLLNPGIEPVSPALQADSLPTEPPAKPQYAYIYITQSVCYTRETNTL